MNIKKCILFILILSSCNNKTILTTELPLIGSKSIQVFDDINLHFDMAFKDNPEKLDDNTLRIDAGRVILKKVKLPNYTKQTKVTINVNLTSNGDPWDKSGSLFVIPKEATLNLLNFETGTFDLKSLNQSYPAISPISAKQLHYLPNVELLRFMTPFGVGYFNKHERTKDRKPPYIPHWEKEVNWSQDITHLLPLLENEVYIGVFIDTWTKEGYNISVKLNFEESQIPNHQKKKQTVVPLVNTVKYAAEQKLYDDFSKQPLTVSFNVKDDYKNAKLYYLTTGHGGHSGGDEFVKKENQIQLNGKNIKTFTPWRDDCASFRRFNPSSGTWPAKEMFPKTESTDMIASSDLSRSNWCPGSDVLPEVIDLGTLLKGKHQLEISIPKAQALSENEYNYWMVSAYIVYDND